MFILNDIITENNLLENNNIKLARLSILLNALGFYNGAANWNGHQYEEIAGQWKYKNLLSIKDFLIKKKEENNGSGVTHMPKMESRILKYFEYCEKDNLENIVFEDFSFLDEELKKEIKFKYGTDVYLFSNKNAKTVYIVYDCAKTGEFSGSIVDSIFDRVPELNGKQTGITEQHTKAQKVAQKFIDHYKKNNQINKIVYIGYSYGGSKALYNYLLGGDEKNECVLINALNLTEKSIDYLEERRDNSTKNFDTLKKKILNVNSVDDPISYANKNPLGETIYFTSGNNQGCDGHDITNMDLGMTAKKSSHSFMQNVFSNFLNDPKKSYDTTKAWCMLYEKMNGKKKGIGTNINDEELNPSIKNLLCGIFYLCGIGISIAFVRMINWFKFIFKSKPKCIKNMDDNLNQKDASSLLKKINETEDKFKNENQHFGDLVLETDCL